MLAAATATRHPFWPGVGFEALDEAEDDVDDEAVDDAEPRVEFTTGGLNKGFLSCGITVFNEKLNLDI